MTSGENNLQVAEEVAILLAENDIGCVVIGAIAMAGHHYVRFTEDIDLGVEAEHDSLSEVAERLSERGYEVDYRVGDMDDPLAGVMDISGSFGLVQVVNFHERFPAVIQDSIELAEIRVRKGSPLKLVPLAHLVALKLYAGGLKSQSDIVELLKSNKDADLEIVKDTCKKYRLKGLDQILRELDDLNPSKDR